MSRQRSQSIQKSPKSKSIRLYVLDGLERLLTTLTVYMTDIQMMKTKAVITSYGINDKENKKCPNLISVILKIRGLI